jgi:putative phosphoribosyl transferase
MIFANRAEAGRILAKRLAKYADREDVIVLGTPRGGVPIAFEVAKALRVPLDTFTVRKLGVPGYEELAFGAIASGGMQIFNRNLIEKLGLTERDVDQVVQSETRELKRREEQYRQGRPQLQVKGRTVILTDDGIATGASILAALHALRQLQPAALIVATPVAPLATVDRLKGEADEVVCAQTPEPFYGVGQFYEDFSQVSDEEVTSLLERASGEVFEDQGVCGRRSVHQ